MANLIPSLPLPLTPSQSFFLSLCVTPTPSFPLSCWPHFWSSLRGYAGSSPRGSSSSFGCCVCCVPLCLSAPRSYRLPARWEHAVALKYLLLVCHHLLCLVPFFSPVWISFPQSCCLKSCFGVYSGWMLWQGLDQGTTKQKGNSRPVVPSVLILPSVCTAHQRSCSSQQTNPAGSMELRWRLMQNSCL